MPPLEDCLTDTRIRRIADQVHVNIPFRMLAETYGPQFIEHRLNPEIGLDADALDSFSFREFRKMGRRLLSHGLTVSFHAPFMDLSPGSPDPEIREVTRRRFQQVLALIPLFQPTTVVCHAAFEERRYGFLGNSWTEKSCALWSWMAAEVGHLGATLVLENVFEKEPREIKDLLARLPHNPEVGFCLDSGHQSAFGSVPLETWIEQLGPAIRQLHLHDNRGARDDHMALGQGRIEFNRLFDYLKSRPQPPPQITLEPHREADLPLSLAYLADIWPW